MSQQSSAPQLPFQPINARQESGNSDSLYQQKLNERSMLDMASPQQQSQQLQIQLPGVQPQPNLNFNPPSPPPGPHPSVLAMFLSLNPEAQQRFATANPVAYAQLCLAAQQYVQSQAQEQQALTEPHTVKKKKSKKISKTVHVQSESDNFHSSDEELNIKPSKHMVARSRETEPTAVTTIQQAQHHHHLPLDFRNNLCNITEHGYGLRWPRQYRNVQSIELVDCTIQRTPTLDKEPYIYMSILEIPGEYSINGESSVFGKLIPEKTVNEFIFYKPEHCRKVFIKPVELDCITVSFLQYDQSSISLSKFDLRNLSQGSKGDYYKLNTYGPHYLTAGDGVSITYKNANRVTVEILPVLDTPSADTVILESSSKGLTADDRCAFERVQLKCSLTFKIII
jgi:hypothetical protein